MAAHPPNLSRLDPNLVNTPYKVQTNWHILTGAACTGKTTLIQELSTRGFNILPESARDYFGRELARGVTLDQLMADSAALQRNIFALQKDYERGLDPGTAAFLDRGMPDSLSFFRYWGLDPNEVLPDCFQHCYRTVFLLDRLPLHREVTLGPEDDAASTFLDGWLERDYTSLGYRVIRVPPFSLEERMKLILQVISG